MVQHPTYQTLNVRPTLAWIDRDLLGLAVCVSGLVYLMLGGFWGLISAVVLVSLAAWATKVDPLLPLLWVKSFGQADIYDPGEPDSIRYTIK